MLTLSQILIIVALLFTIIAAAGRLPLWPAVLVLVLVHMLVAVRRAARHSLERVRGWHSDDDSRCGPRQG